jgi:serine phosphatase RsbU (regulator of sigma subunit)
LVPFIFLTATDDINLQEQAARLGVDDYLVKPVDKTKLLSSVQRVLERSRQIYRHLTERIEHRIASALAPSIPANAHGWRLCVANRHTGIGGGDLLLHQSTAEQLRLVLTDIMGHDVSAKFFSHAYGGYLRGLMHAQTGTLCPGTLLEQLSQCALQDALFSQVTLTCCAATLCANGEIHLSSAGHPAPLRISAAGVTAIKLQGMLPGLLPHTKYQTVSLKLAAGERIALYTDGLFESAPSDTGRTALETSINGALTQTLCEPAEQALKKVMTIFDAQAGTPPRDDVTLLLLERL